MHQVWLEIDRELLLHGASKLKTIARVERRLPRDGAHPLPEQPFDDKIILK
jgi:hypothetical protein